MQLMDRTDGHYTRAEKVSDATIHILGGGMGIFGVAALVPLSIIWGDSAFVVGAAAIYSVALLAMLSASASYHMSPQGAVKDWLRRLDHSAIYVKIAGTYTPFIVLSGMAPWMLLSFLWGSACVGGAVRILAPGRFTWLCLSLYLIMGWSGLIIGAEMFTGLGPNTFVLMLIGGLIYTSGVAFFLWESLPFHNTIWHAMVLVATGFFYSALLIELAGPGMAGVVKP